MTSTHAAPATTSGDTSADELRALFDAQRRAHLRDGTPSADARRNRIDRFILAVMESADELAKALDSDFGIRPELFTYRTELSGILPSVQHTRDSLEDWMAPEPVPAGSNVGIPTFLQKKPKGVVGVIGPWNFPIQLTVQPTVEALAAGNRVMIKFSEIPQRTAAVFARAVARRMDPEEVSVILGGPSIAAAFSDLSFDHLFFTGSPGVGRRVAEAAGRNLVPVTLELGGKNPVVVARGADLGFAAERIMGNRMLNGGQLCLCPDYVFVPVEGVDAFVEQYRAHMTSRYPGYASSADIVSSVNPANYRRVMGLIEDAREKGAVITSAIPAEEAQQLPDEDSRRIPPTVVQGATDEMAIASEEIFGPVIAVYPYDDLDEAIDYIAERPHPLTAYWYGEDGQDYRRFLEQTTSGGVTRNDMALHLSIPDVPFGGVGQSGTGYYHGKAGFDTFTHTRAVAASELPVARSKFGTPPYADADLDAARAAVADAVETIKARVG